MKRKTIRMLNVDKFQIRQGINVLAYKLSFIYYTQFIEVLKLLYDLVQELTIANKIFFFYDYSSYQEVSAFYHHLTSQHAE